MLSIKNVHKSFGKLDVLKGVDLTVNKGDVVVILGPSGSGKTTLLRTINFLEPADKGEMDFDNIHTTLNNASKKTIAEIRKNFPQKNKAAQFVIAQLISDSLIIRSSISPTRENVIVVFSDVTLLAVR